MPLINMWKNDPESVLSLTLEQVVSIAGNGQLKDNSDASLEFREYLREIEAEKLSTYAVYCLENAFNSSGQILQDIINEIGRRLGYSVENGRYQGVRNDIGYDGIWHIGQEFTVVEVKTTDAYTIKLDVIVNYRDRLVADNRIGKESPILMVIGRNDTQSLEAQVRGSKHAWSIRIISIEALIKLMMVNINSQSDEVTDKIHTLLTPFEYTRLDRIVDIIFTTSEDRQEQEVELETSVPGESNYLTPERTSKDILAHRKEEAIKKLSSKIKTTLIRRKNSLFSDQSDSIHAAAVVSKLYERTAAYYWYAYHNSPHRDFLLNCEQGFMVFGMADTEDSIAVPYDILEELRGELNSTIKDNGKEYKHIFIYKNNSDYSLRTNSGKSIDLSAYVL
jgi:hypothetical protein